MGSRGAVARVAGVFALALLVIGCGRHAVPAAVPVRLSVGAPRDGARIATGSATVTGAVRPRRARVLILGHAVLPDRSGHFSTSVRLAPGTNLIDVIASAPRARPAMFALRVIRYVLVTVPDVTGKSPGAAATAIRGAGLRSVLHVDNAPLSFLWPFPPQVCSQSPAGGARVGPNSVVTMQASQVCT